MVISQNNTVNLSWLMNFKPHLIRRSQFKHCNFLRRRFLYSCDIFPINIPDLKVLFTYNPLMITISVKLLLHFSRATLLCIILGLVLWLWLLFVKELLLKINDLGSTEKKILSNWYNIIYIKSRQCAVIIWSNKPIWAIEASFII